MTIFSEFNSIQVDGPFSNYINRNLRALIKDNFLYEMEPFHLTKNSTKDVLNFKLKKIKISIRDDRYFIITDIKPGYDGMLLSNNIWTYGSYSLENKNGKIISKTFIRHRKLIAENLLLIIISLVLNINATQPISHNYSKNITHLAILNRIKNKLVRIKWRTVVQCDKRFVCVIRNFADPFILEYDSKTGIKLIGEDLTTDKGQLCIVSIDPNNIIQQRLIIKSNHHRSFPAVIGYKKIIAETLMEQKISLFEIKDNQLELVNSFIKGNFVDTILVNQKLQTTFLIAGVLEVLITIEMEGRAAQEILRSGSFLTRAASKMMESGMWFQDNLKFYGHQRFFVRTDGKNLVKNPIRGHHVDEYEMVKVFDTY